MSTKMKVKDKTVVITGGANGIGFNTVKELLRYNAKWVAILDLPNSNAEDAIKELENQFGKNRATFFACDVTSQALVNSVFKDVVEKLGHIDILINSAGIADELKWETMINVNVIGVVRTTLAGIESMSKHNGGKGGTIVNIASVAGLSPARFIPAYCTTKYAVVGFTTSLKSSYNKTGIRMLLMCPGMTDTAMTRNTHRTSFLSFVDEKGINEELRTTNWQTAEHVSKGIVELIEKGENGAVCVVQNGEPPYLVNIPTVYELEKLKLIPGQCLQRKSVIQ